jgi:hypothetical protein
LRARFQQLLLDAADFLGATAASGFQRAGLGIDSLGVTKGHGAPFLLNEEYKVRMCLFSSNDLTVAAIIG